MTLSECLNTAADLIEQNGWVQGAWSAPGYDDKPAAYCMIGAIRKVCPEIYGQGTPSNHHLTEVLGFPDIDWAILWNDASGRTKEEVVERLRLGAKHAAVWLRFGA